MSMQCDCTYTKFNRQDHQVHKTDWLYACDDIAFDTLVQCMCMGVHCTAQSTYSLKWHYMKLRNCNGPRCCMPNQLQSFHEQRVEFEKQSQISDFIDQPSTVPIMVFINPRHKAYAEGYCNHLGNFVHPSVTTLLHTPMSQRTCYIVNVIYISSKDMTVWLTTTPCWSPQSHT